MANSNHSRKLQLPKSVLDMKFMKKTKERVEKEIENTHDHDSLYSSIITEEMRLATGNFISQSSFLVCENLIEGRLSFKGMNPEIESLMKMSTNNDSEGDMQKDIPDDILAKKMQAFHSRKRMSDTPIKTAAKKRK